MTGKQGVSTAFLETNPVLLSGRSGARKEVSKQSDQEDPTKKVTTQVEAVKVAAAEKIEPKSVRHWRARAFLIFMIIAAVGFGALLVTASIFDYLPIDLRVTRAIQTVTEAWFAQLMWLVSSPGYSPYIYFVVLSIVAVLYFLGLRWEAVTALAAEISAGLVGEGIKRLVQRPRPGADLVNVLRELTSYSFPSGHVLTYTVFFGFLFFLAYTLLKPSMLRTALLIVFGGLVVLVGISRIYLGNHWASDVTGAYLLGMLWLTLCIYVYERGKKRFFVKQPLAPEQPGPTTISKS